MTNISTASSVHRAYRPVRPGFGDRPAVGFPPAPAMPSMPPVPQLPTWQQPSYPVAPQPPYTIVNPGYPTAPQAPLYPQYPSYPQPYPGYNRGPGAFLGDMWGGMKERFHEIGQIVLHPIDARLRRPYLGRNPFAPRTPGETAGRWVVNIGLVVGAVFAGRALLGGGLGGGAGVGMRSGLGNFLSGAAKVVTTPFRWAGNAIGSVLGGVKDAIGGTLSFLFGGARVGMR